jgi:transposase-like protein
MAPTKDAPEKGGRRNLIRIDQLGRCRYTPEFREATVAAFERSGLSGVRFAEQSGVNYTTFATWVQRARRERSQPTGSDYTDEAGVEGLRFAVAEIEGEALPDTPALPGAATVDGGRPGLTVELPGGGVARAEGAGGVGLLAALLRELVKGDDAQL